MCRIRRDLHRRRTRREDPAIGHGDGLHIGHSTDEREVRTCTLAAMGRVGPLLCPILVGRDDLLEFAERRADEVVSGIGTFILFSGEAGIGKSRLLGAIDRKAQVRGFRVAWGDLAPQDAQVPAASLLDLARTMLRRPEFEGVGRELLLRLRDEAALAERPRRRMLVGDLVDLLADALEVPTLLGFEDLQWADDLSLEILAELARRIRKRPVLMLGSYRTDELHPASTLREWRARLLTQRLAEEARLAPLTRDQTGLMTTLILATGLPAPRQVIDAVYERTDGIPLHIEELLGVIGDDARADGEAIRGAAVPDTIEDVVLERLRRRSPEAQAAARTGAVIGRCFVPDVLAGIMGVPPSSLEAPLQELVDHAFLEAPGPRGLYDFRHQLLRDALYRSIREPERRRLHARVAEFGGQLEGSSEIHASVHFERAGLRAQAFRTALAGARAAAQLSSHREAFGLYRRAIDNLPATPSPEEHARLLEAFADEAMAVDANDLAERAYVLAGERYRVAGLILAAAFVAGSLTNARRRLGHNVDDLIESLRPTLAELETLPPDHERERVRGSILHLLAFMQLTAGRIDEATATATEARRTARAIGDVALAQDVESTLGVAAVLSGRPEEGWLMLSSVMRGIDLRPTEDAGVSAFRDASGLAARLMDYARSEAIIREGIAHADRIEQSYCRHCMDATLAQVAWARGRWSEAAEVAEQALADRRGGARAEIGARCALGTTALGRGDLDAARAELERAYGMGFRLAEPEHFLPALWGLAEAALLAGEPVRAAQLCDEARAVCERIGERALLIPFVLTGTRARLAANRPDEAERWLEAVQGQLTDAALLGATVALRHATGLVRLAAGSTGLARDALEAAVAGWDRIGRAWEASWARLDLAACLLRVNRAADAMSLLSDVNSAAVRLGSQPLEARAEELRRVARGRGGLDEPWAPLTAREFEVARLIAAGLTNLAIATELAIAPKTASAHVEHILAKLGATRRAEIASWATTVDGRRPGGRRWPVERPAEAPREAERAGAPRP